MTGGLIRRWLSIRELEALPAELELTEAEWERRERELPGPRPEPSREPAEPWARPDQELPWD